MGNLSKEDVEKMIGGLIGIAAVLFMMVFNPYMFMMMWKWFIVPLNVPPISIWQSFGIFLMIGSVVLIDEKKRTFDETLQYVWKNFCRSVWSAAIAFAIHIIMTMS